MAAASPVLIPFLGVLAVKHSRGVKSAEARNTERMNAAQRLDLPELERLEISVVVDWRHEEGFLGDAGVSYLIRTDKGTLLMDVGFGPGSQAFGNNAKRLGIDFKGIDAVMITHLHPDHMGGMGAARKNSVLFPDGMEPGAGTPCYIPAGCQTAGLRSETLKGPKLVEAGLASTGPLSRMITLMGMTEEQAIVGRLKGKGLVVITGCGHPKIETILKMAARMSDAPVYAVAGGLHFPVSESRLVMKGIQLQQILGTGKQWWERVTFDDVDRTIESLNRAGVKKLLLSAHDTCDGAIERFKQGVKAETEVLSAGRTYQL
jgi:7,8-dihydropterin-6-yl-methyl-4-(beta-D-ribofuranosyl)aminobenzene 5'-phosphate synthase